MSSHAADLYTNLFKLKAIHIIGFRNKFDFFIDPTLRNHFRTIKINTCYLFYLTI